MASSVAAAVEAALGVPVLGTQSLSGGCIGDVLRVDLEDGRCVVAKFDSGAKAQLDIEAYMLRYLTEHSSLPVPEVLHGAPELLVMTWVEGDSRFSAGAERDAAEILARLHAVRGDRYGLERDTLIGGLHQPNAPMDSWVDFFRERRLLYMAGEARRAGRFGNDVLSRIESFSVHLREWLEEPEYPSLLHGDIWTTNVLADRDRITGFLDPAVYYGHPEIELAFITLFSTFGDSFFRRYDELRSIREGFFDVRRDIYNMYPLLVHVRLFGSGYLDGVERVLSRHGF